MYTISRGILLLCSRSLLFSGSLLHSSFAFWCCCCCYCFCQQQDTRGTHSQQQQQQQLCHNDRLTDWAYLCLCVCVSMLYVCVYIAWLRVCVSVCVLVHAPRQAAKASGQGWLLQEPKPGIHFQAPVIFPSPYLSPSFSHCWHHRVSCKSKSNSNKLSAPPRQAQLSLSITSSSSSSCSCSILIEFLSKKKKNVKKK